MFSNPLIYCQERSTDFPPFISFSLWHRQYPLLRIGDWSIFRVQTRGFDPDTGRKDHLHHFATVFCIPQEQGRSTRFSINLKNSLTMNLSFAEDHPLPLQTLRPSWIYALDWNEPGVLVQRPDSRDQQ